MIVAALTALLTLRAVSAVCPSADGAQLLNSYQNVSVSDPEVAQLAKLAAQAYISNASSPHVQSCHHGGGGGGALQLDGLQTVEAACGQLVAGMNYDITFSQRVHCGNQAPVPVVLEALAFVPLPLAGQNGPPQINSVTEVG